MLRSSFTSGFDDESVRYESAMPSERKSYEIEQVARSASFREWIVLRRADAVKWHRRKGQVPVAWLHHLSGSRSEAASVGFANQY
jgi:hypothetical protein